MRVLLDTHTFIWWSTTSHKLSSNALAVFNDPDSSPLLSLASVWELQIKYQLGKLTLPVPVLTLVTRQQENGIELLPITLAHIIAIGQLPSLHGDPFDRLLIAQSRIEDIALVTDDRWIREYDVKTIW
jgi:PIN domain nuclease of toxin-antitoxin system